MQQMKPNNLIALFVRIKDLLKAGRLQLVYSVANRQDLDLTLRECFRSLADMIALKNNDIKEFYQIFFIQIINHGRLDLDKLVFQGKNIPNDCREQAITFGELYLRVSQEGRLKTEQINELKERLDIVEAERKSLELEKQTNANQISELRKQIENLRLKECKEAKEAQEIKINLFKENKILQQQLSAQKIEIQELKKNCSTLQNIVQMLQQKKELLEPSVKETTTILNSIIQEKTEEIENLRSKLANDNLNFQSSISSLAQSKQLILFSKSQPQLPAALSATLQNQVGKAIAKIQRIYSFAQQGRQNFHETVDFKTNILLLGLTTYDRLVGAFTTASFSLREQSPKTKAFLFGMKGEKISLGRLKRGKDSVFYDTDFLIFGNEELCIEKGKATLTSYCSSAMTSELHYAFPSQDDYFLDALEDSGTAELKDYQIFCIDFIEND